MLEIILKVNGRNYQERIQPWCSLADVLREHLGLTGTKRGCSTGNCGSCTVLIDGKAVKSCLVLASQAVGKEITTIEGLAYEENLHPIQQAFVNNFAFQCGFCTSGMIMSVKGLLNENPAPNEDEIRHALAGNICRCTGYVSIIKAVQEGSRSLANI